MQLRLIVFPSHLHEISKLLPTALFHLRKAYVHQNISRILCPLWIIFCQLVQMLLALVNKWLDLIIQRSSFNELPHFNYLLASSIREKFYFYRILMRQSLLIRWKPLFERVFLNFSLCFWGNQWLLFDAFFIELEWFIVTFLKEMYILYEPLLILFHEVVHHTAKIANIHAKLQLRVFGQLIIIWTALSVMRFSLGRVKE